MHVLYLIDSLARGGAESSLAALAPHLVDGGTELTVGYLHDRPGVQAELYRAGARVHSLAGRGGRVGWIRRTAKLIDAEKPDLVHTTLFEADVAGRIAAGLRRVPVVSSLVNPQYGPEQFNDPRLSAWRIRAAHGVDVATARRVVRFHAITEHVADLMARRLRIARHRIDVVPRGRDPRALGTRSRQRRARARAELGASRRTALVVVAARQEHQKGLDVLLEAFPQVLERVGDARLVVAGREGIQTPFLGELVDRLGLGPYVTFLGARTDVPELLCAADLFVLPSRWEGLGSVLLEAMGLEAPIVASALPAVREVVSGDQALLVRPERPRELADAISSALLDRNASLERARRARIRFLERFTIARIAEQTIAFYGRALAQAGSPLAPRSAAPETR